MTTYYLLVVFVLAFAFLMQGDRAGNYKYIYLAVLLLFCVYGLRDAYSIGNDSSTSYLHQFQTVGETEWKDLPLVKGADSQSVPESDSDLDSRFNKNIGISWVMKAVYDSTDGDYQIFIVLISAFVMIALAHFVRKYSPSPVQTILLYFGLLFFTFNFSALKQSVAMGFILLSFDGVVERKPLKFLVLLWLAVLFHFPALVFLPAYWIANMKIGRSYLLLIVIMFAATYLFRDTLLDWMTDAYETQIIDTNIRFLANKVIVMIIILVAAVIVRPPHSSDRIYCSVLMLVGVAAVLQTFSSYNNTFERLADYYFQFAVVLIPMVFEKTHTERRHLSERELLLIQNCGPYVFSAFSIIRFLDYVASQSFLNHYQFYFQAKKTVEELMFRSIL